MCLPYGLDIDPEDILCKNMMGFHSKIFDQLIEDVKTLLKNKTLREEMGVNGRMYVERERDIKKVVEKYIEIFEEVNE